MTSQSASNNTEANVAVVIPCYRSGDLVLSVIEKIGPEVGWIFVVDDDCPLKTGDQVEDQCKDSRVTVLRHTENQGVGGATVTGYKAALQTAARIMVKIDGDGQMDPGLIPLLARPVSEGLADYSKGNRFYNVHDVATMPAVRLFGNAVLSFLTKLSSGYWQLFDPTNGYTAVHRSALEMIELDFVARRYFFESDMLYNLYQARAVVREMPMKAVYEDEPSSLKPGRVIGTFLRGHLRNLMRRIGYNYFIRGFSAASMALVVGMGLMSFGLVYGGYHWWQSAVTATPASAGTVMMAALPVMLGVHLLISWLNFDIASEPRLPLQYYLDQDRTSIAPELQSAHAPKRN